MKEDIRLKYEPMSPEKVTLILEAYKHEQVYDYILELYDLINYQKDIIKKQTIELVALKHKKAWQQYDKKDCDKNKTIDKPCKDGNISC